MHDLYKIADTVLMKVADIEIKSIKNFIAVNKFLPVGTPKNWGHKFFPNIHKYAICKNIKDRIYIIFSTRIGTIKKVYPFTYEHSNSEYTSDFRISQKYDVLWHERDERNQEKGFGRHNEIETYYADNLVKLSDIEKFITEDEFVEFCEKFFLTT